MEKIDDKTIATVKAANPGTELHHIAHDTLPDEILARPPTGMEWRMFRAMQAEEDVQQKVAAARMLVDSCTIYPGKAELAAMLEAHPGLIETFAGEITEAAGLSRKARRKKV